MAMDLSLGFRGLDLVLAAGWSVGEKKEKRKKNKIKSDYLYPIVRPVQISFLGDFSIFRDTFCQIRGNFAKV
jgi:hypothetical protein